MDEGPPFAPAAERWTLMLVESIETDPHAPLCPLSASNTANHTPCRLQRWKRLWIVVYDPYSDGQSRQRAPLLSMCTIPEITRRSSTRCAPLRPCGNSSILAHSASLNHVRYRAIQSLRSKQTP